MLLPMKAFLFIILVLSSTTVLAQAGKYAKKTWCTGLADNEVYDHIKNAADFADLDPLLLAIGMSSEGFAVKEDFPTKCRNWPTFNDDKSINVKQCDEGDKTVDIQFDSYKPWVQNSSGEWVEGKETWDIFAIMPHVYYGDTWPDDGADTFCLELGRLRREGLFPMEFSQDNTSRLPQYDSLESAPEVLCDDSGHQNEPATMRYHKDSMSLPYEKRWRVPSDKTEGDKGRAFFKDGETQAFANAAMWKDASNKFDKAFNEIKALHPTLNDKEFSKEERIFWTKVFYNGGQGTQAGAYYMLKKYAANGYLANENYLTNQPTNSYAVLYENGRYTLDSYQYATSINCPEQWPSPQKSYTRYADSLNNSSQSAPEPAQGTSR